MEKILLKIEHALDFVESSISSCLTIPLIVSDNKFHLVQLIPRSFNKTRIHAMKSNKAAYNKMKRYWKLILKVEMNLIIQNGKDIHVSLI